MKAPSNMKGGANKKDLAYLSVIPGTALAYEGYKEYNERKKTPLYPDITQNEFNNLYQTGSIRNSLNNPVNTQETIYTAPSPNLMTGTMAVPLPTQQSVVSRTDATMNHIFGNRETYVDTNPNIEDDDFESWFSALGEGKPNKRRRKYMNNIKGGSFWSDIWHGIEDVGTFVLRPIQSISNLVTTGSINPGKVVTKPVSHNNGMAISPVMAAGKKKTKSLRTMTNKKKEMLKKKQQKKSK